MPSPNLTEIVTTTLRLRSGELADNVSNNNALLRRLNERGNIRTAPGGRTIVEELEYAENSTYTRYSGYETLNISPSDVFTAAEFDWKQAAVAISMSGLEQLQNSGREAIINLLDKRIGNAERTMSNNLSTDIYSDGTADSGKQIGGLQLIVADAQTGTVGGIDSSTHTFWQNALLDGSVDVGGAIDSTNIQQAMNLLWLRTKRGPDDVDLIVFDDAYYESYWASLQTIQRISDTDTAEAGFRALRFKGADVIPDGGVGGDAPASHGYFLNTTYLFWRPHSDRNMVPLEPERFGLNQDAMVKLIAFAGNMTCSNRSLQGVMID